MGIFRRLVGKKTQNPAQKYDEENEEIAQKLIQLIPKAHSEFNTKNNTWGSTKEEIERIGNYLCDNGGSERMKTVAHRVAALGGRIRDCELFWEGICGWRY